MPTGKLKINKRKHSITKENTVTEVKRGKKVILRIYMYNDRIRIFFTEGPKNIEVKEEGKKEVNIEEKGNNIVDIYV